MKYDLENWRRLVEYLNTDDYHKIHVYNRAQLLHDVSKFDYLDPVYFELSLDMLSYLHREIDYLPWIPAKLVLENFVQHLLYTPNFDVFKKFVFHLLDNITNHIGFDERDSDGSYDVISRLELSKLACTLGHEGCIAAATAKFSQRISDKIR